MVTLFQWLWKKLKGLFTLILPMMGRAASGARSRVAFWIVHVILISLIVAGLTWANQYFDLPRYLSTPLGWMALVWLPALFLLLYVNLWLGYWLWKLLGPSTTPSPYPDIDEAWAETLAAIDRGGIDIHRAPLYLVLGRPQGNEDALFRTADIPFNMYGPPTPAPVRAYATTSAGFILAADCCLTEATVRWAKQLAKTEADTTLIGANEAEEDSSYDMDLPTLTQADESQETEATNNNELILPPTRNPGELKRLTARLRHLCRLISQSRRPYCPINGILVLIPEACSRNEAAAGLAGRLASDDLHVIKEELQQHCPVIGIISDCEQLPGFVTLLERIPEQQKGQRLGRKLPYAPKINSSQRAEMVSDAVHWICRELVPRLTYKVMPDPGEQTPSKEKLVRLASTVFHRRESLVRIFTGMYGTEGAHAVWAGGCYLTGTGPRAEQQGFLSDIFAQLIEDQNFVAWTEAGHAAESRYRRRTRLGYLFLAFALVGTGLLVAATAWALL